MMQPWKKNSIEVDDLSEEHYYVWEELIDLQFYPPMSPFVERQMKRFKATKDQGGSIPPHYLLLIDFIDDLEQKILRQLFHCWEINRYQVPDGGSTS